MQVIEFARRLDAKIAAERPEFAKFPDNFPVSREFERGDRFEHDCVGLHDTQACASDSALPLGTEASGLSSHHAVPPNL